MSEGVPFSQRTVFLDSEFQRCQDYIAYYAKRRQRMQKECNEQTQHTMTLIDIAASKAKEGELPEMDPFLADNICSLIEEELATLGLYEEEEQCISQFGLHVQHRNQQRKALQAAIEEKRMNEGKKSKIKEAKVEEKSQGEMTKSSIDQSEEATIAIDERTIMQSLDNLKRPSEACSQDLGSFNEENSYARAYKASKIR